MLGLGQGLCVRFPCKLGMQQELPRRTHREVQDLAAGGGLAGIYMAYEHDIQVFPAQRTRPVRAWRPRGQHACMAAGCAACPPAPVVRLLQLLMDALQLLLPRLRVLVLRVFIVRMPLSVTPPAMRKPLQAAVPCSWYIHSSRCGYPCAPCERLVLPSGLVLPRRVAARCLWCG